MLTAPGRAGAVSSPGLLSGFIQEGYVEGSRCPPSFFVPHLDGKVLSLEIHGDLLERNLNHPCLRAYRVDYEEALLRVHLRLDGPVIARAEDEDRLFLVPGLEGKLVSRALSPADDAELPDLEATATTVAEHRRVSRVFRLSHIDLPNGFLPLSRNQ